MRRSERPSTTGVDGRSSSGLDREYAGRMCGRYAAKNDVTALVEEFDLDAGAAVTGAHPVVPEPDDRLPADYNVAPTKPVYIIAQRREKSRGRADGAETGSGAATVRKLLIADWGLVPSWAKDPSIGSRMINARVETLASKPAFRKAFAQRRCLIPADGYYEWYAPELPTGEAGAGSRRRAPKQPYYFSDQSGAVLAMAGLYEIWRSPDVADPDAPGAWKWSCTVITTNAADEFGRIHDRMPMAVAPENYQTWLDGRLDDPREALGAPTGLTAVPVSTQVNNVANNGPDLIAPMPIEPPTETSADDDSDDSEDSDASDQLTLPLGGDGRHGSDRPGGRG